MPLDARTRYLTTEESTLSIRNRCTLLSISRSNVYYKKTPESILNIEIKDRIEEIWDERNNKGSRVITAELRTYDNLPINRKRIISKSQGKNIHTTTLIGVKSLLCTENK